MPNISSDDIINKEWSEKIYIRHVNKNGNYIVKFLAP